MPTIAIIAHHAASLLNFRGLLIRDLAATGVRVVCLAPDYSADIRTAIQALGGEPVNYPLQRTGMNPVRDGLTTFGLIRYLRRLRPDVVFAFSIKPVIYGTLAAWMAGVPRRVAMIEGAGYVFTVSGEEPGWRRRVLRWVVGSLYRVSLSHAHRVIFLNQDDIEEFVAGGLVRRDRCSLLGGIGVDLDEWCVLPHVETPVTFLLAARLLREKGIVEYVAAARQVRQRYPEARFILLGGLDTNPGGLSREDIQSWVDEGILEWYGHVPVQPWLAQTSVYVLPSYREGVPRSTQEAMATGRPVITTDVPGCRETVEDGVNGYMIPVRDVDALAGAMCRFLAEPGLVASMGEASRRLAEERFDVRQVNARLSQWLMSQ